MNIYNPFMTGFQQWAIIEIIEYCVFNSENKHIVKKMGVWLCQR